MRGLRLGRRGGGAGTLRALLRVVSCAPALLGCDGAWSRPPPRLAPPTHDHHVHLLGPELVHDWKSLGVPFSRPDSAYTSVSAALLEGGATHAFVVSMAHVYGQAEFREALGLGLEEEHARVRRTNDHVAAEVARMPGRLVGFCAVDPLRPWAAAEVARCAEESGLAGVKLHLPSAGVDLSRPEHVEALASLAAEAARRSMPLLIHMPGGRAGAAVVSVRFLAAVLEANEGLVIYLAHAGGGGGYRPASRGVLQGLLERAADAPWLERVWLELSGAVLDEPADGVPASRAGDLRRLARDLREFGLERVLFGSDYPVFSPGSQARLLARRLPLSDAELERVLGNRAPAFEELTGPAEVVAPPPDR